MTMKMTINKAFPWFRKAYKAGDVVEIDDLTGHQWAAAGLAKPANKASEKSLQTRLPGNRLSMGTPEQKSKEAAEKAAADKAKSEQKPAADTTQKPVTDGTAPKSGDAPHVVPAMDAAKDSTAAALVPGDTKPYKTRDLKSSK